MFVKIINWLENNKEWVFSGIGITAIIGLLNLLFQRKKRNHNVRITQTNHGKESVQIAVQNNYFNGEKKDKRVSSRNRVIVVTLLLMLLPAVGVLIYTLIIGPPELYKSGLASYSEMEHYEILQNISDSSIMNEKSGNFEYVFAIVSHLKNLAFTGKKVDSTTTTITEMVLDDSMDIGTVGDIYKDTLKIFMINNSWGTARDVLFEVFFQDNGKERPITDALDAMYECGPVTIESGNIIKGADFYLNKEKFTEFIDGFDKRNNLRILPVYCRMTTSEEQCEDRIGWIGYEESRGGFYLSAGGGDEPENVYKSFFCKLDVDEALDRLNDSGNCIIRFIGKDAYPLFDRFVTIETAIAPTKSCYITCHNTFE